MPEIPATEFKAKCLELMDRVAERYEIYVITKRGRPVAKLAPLEQKPKGSIFGWLRGSGSIAGDILGPIGYSDDWEGLKEWEEINAAGKPRRKGKVRANPRSSRSAR